MSNNWHSGFTGGGGSGGNSSRGFSNDFNQFYGGKSFKSGNYVGNFTDNRGGFNPRYGRTGTRNIGNLRRDYEPRYGENGCSNYRGSHGDNFGGGYEPEYGEDASSNYGANYSGNFGGDFQARYGVSYSGNFTGGYDSRYGEGASSNYRAYCFSYKKFGRGVEPSFVNKARGNRSRINYAGNNRERYNDNEKGTGGSGNKANDGDWQIFLNNSLLEGSIVVVKEQKGRPKYRCLHCKITFFNFEHHIKRSRHLSHMKHCIDAKACFHATVGKRGVGLNLKKVDSDESDGSISNEVKAEPYQSSLENEYIEKDIKEEDMIIKQEKMELDKTDMANEDFKVNTVKIKAKSNQECVQNYFKNDIKEEVHLNNEWLIKPEMSSQQKVQNYITNHIKEEMIFPEIDVKKELIIKEEMDDKSKKINIEKRIKESKKEMKQLNRYACLDPDCPETFKKYGEACRHMEMKGIKPKVGKSKSKAIKQRGMRSEKKKVPVEN